MSCFLLSELAKIHIAATQLTDAERFVLYNENKKEECDNCNARLKDAIFIRLPERLQAAHDMLRPPTKADFLDWFQDRWPEKSIAQAMIAWKAVSEDKCKTLADAIDLVHDIDAATNEAVGRILLRRLLFQNLDEEKEPNAEKDSIH